MQTVRIFGYPPINGLTVTKETFDNQKRMLDLGANRGFATFDLFSPIE
jgi:hypothetical protein